MGKLVPFKDYIKLQEYERSVGGFNLSVADLARGITSALAGIPKLIGQYLRFTRITYPQFKEIYNTYKTNFSALKYSYKKMIDTIPKEARHKPESQMGIAFGINAASVNQLEKSPIYKEIMRHEREFVKHVSDFISIVEANPLITAGLKFFGINDARILFAYIVSDNFVENWNQGETDDEYKLLTLRELETSSEDKATVINYFKRKARMEMISEIRGSRIWSAPIPVAPRSQETPKPGAPSTQPQTPPPTKNP